VNSLTRLYCTIFGHATDQVAPGIVTHIKRLPDGTLVAVKDTCGRCGAEVNTELYSKLKSEVMPTDHRHTSTPDTSPEGLTPPRGAEEDSK